MADDGETPPNNNSNTQRTAQETFHGTPQEARLEHRFPKNPTGIGQRKRGPKSLCLQRNGDSFGFTLRHFIVYPPDSIADNDGRYAAVGALSAPMDTIFVKHVKDYSPAKKAGLRQGDRLIKVNDVLVQNKSYAQVVQLIQNTREWLDLLVVPKEDDILQRYFAETAYNPASNQDFAPHHQPPVHLREFQVDALSWRSLQSSYCEPLRPVVQQRSADDLLLHDSSSSPYHPSRRSRAQPQAPPLHPYPTSTSRRASDGCALSDAMKSSVRRESASSLSSSQADGSKDSLSSYDSTNTLTGNETDDSSLLWRVRRSVQQKEEFLRMAPLEERQLRNVQQQREFYGKPKKLDRALWPPGATPSRPTHQNFQRVKLDIETERAVLTPPELVVKEGEVPSRLERAGLPNGSLTGGEEGYSAQSVHKRARQFESGQEEDRTSFFRSELARLSSKKVVPNVSERAHEFEVLGGRESPKKAVVQRDTRSLESNDSDGSPPPVKRGDPITKRLSGNVMISTGSKYIHCLPPSECGKYYAESLDNKVNRVCTRSNSAESWVTFESQEQYKPNENKRISRQDAVIDDGDKSKVGEDKPVVVKRRPKNTNIVDDERATRRESYLKATEGGRMHIDSDTSDCDVSPLTPRSGSSSSSASLDKSILEKDKGIVIREGPLHCKITEIDGKRSGDRSWKQIWAALKGPKLFLHRDKHHQSPMGASDAVEHSLATGVDMRASEVRVAEDYTKRKHVLRVSSVNPCRSEFLLQADNTEEFTDWLKALQEQVATNTEAESKFDPHSVKQQAVPQSHPASTSILVPASANQSKPKPPSIRARSPTGQSPVSKTRKPSLPSTSTFPMTTDGGVPSSTSPKAKTWRGRMAKQFRKIQGASSPSSPTAPEVSTFGVPLDQCLCSVGSPYVPKFVEVCTDIVDAKGLQTVGIYRVPGNNASIAALREEVNRNYDDIPEEDHRWNDLHVVSSLLKEYFRKIPDSLVTGALYPHFIKADKIENPKLRMLELKRLIRLLPPHNYHTLRHIILHLRKVVDNSDVNKMEAKNLAIVFGPNIVRAEDDNMENMVNNMTHQCKIVETFLNAPDWFFGDGDGPIPDVGGGGGEEEESANQNALLDNISKYEATYQDKTKNNALLSSIISAAQRKVKRKTKHLNESKEEVLSPLDFPSINDLKESGNKSVIPTTVADIEKITKSPSEKVPWFNYSTDKEDFHKRIETFKQETEAMLQMPRQVEISVNNIPKSPNLTKSLESPLLKTHSASNVFSRSLHSDNRHSLDNSSYHYTTKCVSEFGGSLQDNNRRSGSAENVNAEVSTNGGLKKVKYETEGDAPKRSGSLESLNKVTTDDDTDLTSVIALLDKKLNEPNLLSGEGLPFVDESPEKVAKADVIKEVVTDCGDLYRNPSLHKSKQPLKDADKDEDCSERDKDRVTKSKILRRSESLNKQERNVSPLTKVKRSESLNKGKDEKLKRSDSLTKTEKTESNLNKRRELRSVTKLKRKNGMPDRSIKRRHTVGGTKDPDKITWLDNKKYEEEVNSNKENKEKNLRTSSPDLSSARRDKLCLEVNFFRTGDMVVALKQHLMGTRPQSFPDNTNFNLLESHV